MPSQKLRPVQKSAPGLLTIYDVRIIRLSSIPRFYFLQHRKHPISAKKKKNRGSYMSAHVLLNLLNELGKRDKMRGLPSILSLFRNEFNKFNNTRARM